MMRARLMLFLFLLLFATDSWQPLLAQDQTSDTLSLPSSQTAPWQNLLENIMDMEDFESAHWEDYEEELEELADHPMNINTATREDMERLPFLTARQVEDIQYYIYRYHGMKSLGELALIPSISWYQRQLMGYFFFAGEEEKKGFPSMKTIAQYGKHEVMGMLKVPFYERKGDKEGYLGYPYKHWLRYQMRYGDYVKFGFLGSLDAGEPFFRGNNKTGYDFYTFYLQVKKLGRWKNITLGRYRLHEGMGLILNNDFSFGKLSLLSSLGRNSNVIRVHSSRSSANYLQGAAATYSLTRHLDLTAFFSYRQIDGTLKNGGIRTIVKTGLHRSQSEIEKQNVASNMLVGGNLNYRNNGWHVGATAFYTSFSLPLTPNTSQLYKRFAPAGNRFWNASVDYGYISHRWTIAGETATGDCGVIATINSASCLFSEKFTLTALQRFYSARYYSLFSNTFAEGSEAQDESGVYLGFTWSPWRRWSITAYSDFAYFAWPKYLTNGSTQSWDNMVSVLYQPSKSWLIGGRMRYKDKAGTATSRLRLYASVTKSNWNARTSLDYSSNHDTGEGTQSRGYMLSENVGWHWRWLRLSGVFGYFHTSDYASRIYVYEPGLLYQMGFASYYGEGIRYALVARSEISSRLLLMAKIGTTNYFDRNHIGSGLQKISASHQTDLEILVKWKL